MSFGKMKNQACAYTLFSGSSGNSIYVENKDSRILIDAGVSAKRLEAALRGCGADPAALDGILVTHEHNDHIAGLSVMARRWKLPVYMSKKTYQAALPKLNFAERMDVRFIEADTPFELKGMAIKPFRIPHDAAEPLGFRIDTGHGVFAVASDIGQWTETISGAVRGSDLVFIEANYDPEMLWGGPYPWPLKKRIDSENGHLSNLACADAVEELLQSGTTRFVLIHLSKENNLPDLAYSSVEEQLKRAGAACGSDYTMMTAPRYSPGCRMNI